MRTPFVLPLAVFLSACSPSPPRSPDTSRAAADMPPDLGSLNPIGEIAKNWCYEVGNAPARINPRCEPSPELCTAKLAEARQEGLAEGFGDPFSECRPMRSNDIQRARRLSGKFPVYSHKAREAGAQGKVVVECWITVSGDTEDCHIITSVPLLDQDVLDALATWHFEPMRFVGRAVRTKHKVPFVMRLE